MGAVDYEEIQYGCAPEAPRYLRSLPSWLLAQLYKTGLKRHLWRYRVELIEPLGNDKRRVQVDTNIGLVLLKEPDEVKHEVLTWWNAEDVLKMIFKFESPDA
jgi:hypothetical protein